MRKASLEQLQESNEKCSFGQHLRQECHRKTKNEIISFSLYSQKDQQIYVWRADLTEKVVLNMCRYHGNVFSDTEFMKNSKCCDIFNLHKNLKNPAGTRRLSLEKALLLKKLNFMLFLDGNFATDA